MRMSSKKITDQSNKISQSKTPRQPQRPIILLSLDLQTFAHRVLAATLEHEDGTISGAFWRGGC
jgi:hypothetical protein